MLVMWRYTAPRSKDEFHVYLDEVGAERFEKHLDRAAASPGKVVSLGLEAVPLERLGMGFGGSPRLYVEASLVYGHRERENIRVEETGSGRVRLAFDAIGRNQLVEAAHTYHDLSLPAGPKSFLCFWQFRPTD